MSTFTFDTQYLYNVVNLTYTQVLDESNLELTLLVSEVFYIPLEMTPRNISSI